MRSSAAISLALFGLAAAKPAVARAHASFLYPLADSVGKMAFGWAPMTWDAQASELYIVDNRNGVVDVFNDNGMVIYSFGDSAGGGLIAGVAALPGGELLVLRKDGQKDTLQRCNFRGDPIDVIEVRGAPESFLRDFSPGAVHFANGRIYLADKGSMKVLIAGLDGAYESSLDLAQLAGIDESKRADAFMRGFSVDGEGNLLFTVATLFRAYVVAPDGSVRSFGVKGSVPGKFNVVGGIVSDGEGHLFVSDTLRSVVMVFESSEPFRFLGEFGYRGNGPGNLVNPVDLVVGNGRVYVSQSVGSVKAFGVLFE